MSRPTSAESVFRAIAHPTRRRVLELLRSGERAAGELMGTEGLTKTTLSAHLSILREAGLVAARQRGASLHYRLNDRALKPVVDWAQHFTGPRRVHP